MSSCGRIPLRIFTLSYVIALVATVAGAPAHAEPSPSDLAARIDKASSGLEQVIENYNKVGEQLKATRIAADALSTTLQPTQARVQAAQTKIGVIASTAYKGTSPSRTGTLLSASSPISLVSQLTFLDQIAYAQRQEINAYNAITSQYNYQKNKLDAALQQQLAQEKDLAAQKTKIQDELKALQQQRNQAGIADPSSPVGLPAPHLAGNAGQAVDYAYGAVGKPYIFGAEGSHGYDCSGLTLAAWRSAGHALPHNAAMQWAATTRISRTELAPGDLVFTNGLGHVALYVGNNQVIHAPQPGQSVKLVSLDQAGSLYGYGRVSR